jgi:DNA-binding CsgD family transcriptional regulator
MRDSENVDFMLPDGHTALCISYERGHERRRSGGGVARAEASAMLRVLLPALKSGVAALLAHGAHRSAFVEWIERSGDASQLVDRVGRCVLRNAALAQLLAADRDAADIERAMARALPRIRTARATYAIDTVQAPATLGDRLRLVTVRVCANEPPSLLSTSTTRIRERFGLTAREADVALLLAERATNPEIAARLGVSAHTVRHHAERVFLKLDVTSRRAIAARIADRDD